MRTSLIVVLALVACQPSVQSELGDPAEWVEVDPADRGVARSSLTLTGDSPVSWGETAIVSAAGAGPGESVYLIRGSREGAGPCPSVVGGMCLSVKTPITPIGSVEADASGVATFAVPLPVSGPPGAALALQSLLIRGPGGVDSLLSNVLTVDVVESGSDLFAPIGSVDLGDVAPGCTVSQLVRVDSVGVDPVLIDSIVVSGDGFALVEPPLVPVELVAGDSLGVEVAFTPDAEGLFFGELVFTSDDPASPLRVDLTGNGDSTVACEGTSTTDVSVVAEYRVADVAFLLDTTGSMGALVDAMAVEFANIAAELRAVVPDVTFGVAQYDDYNFGAMGTGVDRPFLLVHQQTTDDAAVTSALADHIELHSGSDAPESTFEALYQTATGLGYDQNCDGAYESEDDVAPFIADSGDAFGGTVPGRHDPTVVGTGERGGFGFRAGTSPFVVYATDAELRDPLAGYDTPGGCPMDASSLDAVSAFHDLGAKAIGVAVNGVPGSTMMDQMLDFAVQTGSLADLDGDGTAEPAVVSWASASPGFRSAVVDTVLATLDATVFDKVDLEIDSDPLGLVIGVEPEAYFTVGSGTELDFSISVNGAVVDASDPGAVAVQLRIEANDAFDLGTVEIYVLP